MGIPTKVRLDKTTISIDAGIKMNRLVLRTFILSSVFVAAIFAASHFDNDEFGGDSDFDSDWFWIGSNLRSMGRPKLKITEHPDGYSMQIGYTGHYMRFRYTYSDHSLDFNIMDYKGSVQFKGEGGPGTFDIERTCRELGEWCNDPAGVSGRLDCSHCDSYDRLNNKCPECIIDEPEFELKLNIAGGKEQRYGPDLDATMKVKHEEGLGGAQHIEISIVNLFSRKGNRLYMPGARMKDAEHLEAVIKIKVNPYDFVDSSMSFNMNAKGDIYQYISGNDYDSNWFPGNYNMTASVQVISLDKSNPRQRQPKMTAALDLEEEVTFDMFNDSNATNLPRSEKLLKKSLVIDGMINLTGKGSRLAVMKVTDAENDKALGRIQARREDEETMKLEFFMHGEQVAALNYFQNEAGMTNITMEDMQDPECMNDYDFETPSFNSTSFNTTSLNETIENEIEGSTWDNCKTTNRFLESFSGDGVYESRIYKDIFLIGTPPGHRKQSTKGERSLIFEEKMMKKDDVYEGTVMFEDVGSAYERNSIHCKLNNSGDEAHIEMEMKNEYLDWQDDKYHIGNHEKLTMDITPSEKEEDDFNMKLSYNDDRIFDGWFYLTRLIQRYAKQQVPAMIERTLAGFQESHAETTQYLSEFI